MAEFVTLEVSDGIGTIRLDRPPMNALNRQVQEEIRAAAREATVRADVKAVIVYGGEKVFAAGADIKELAETSFVQMSEIIADLQSAIGSIADIPKPTVAAITGYALGGGLELALGADRRVIGDNVKVGTPEILLGIIPGGGGTQRLARLVGPSKAKDIVFTGRFVGPDEALEIGLVDEVVAPDEVYNAARTWASQFTGAASRALAAAKAAIDQGLDTDLGTGLKIEQHVFASLFATADRTIGMESFMANGPGKAVFTGE
ncbi:enoyl-CoA hydratase-related protein [Rhodococcus zopfii]|uniref:Enoyl-CoA hydratase/isomerase family protein n=1 Tax=Rhodococcus zopfii TaxID=43772 RepID=A0ABU3WM19_9NOCA|nr:enoyl-CoA hydratase/isomerase family protein [Rhodococcus zopfii]